MKHPLTRRRFLQQTAVLGGSTLVAPAILSSAARAAEADLGAYQEAGINWRQAEGETVNVAIIAASYFENLIAVTPTFEALTGIKVVYQKIPPRELRQKHILDLSAKTGNISTAATDPMYYPLYVANGWVDPLDAYLGDSELTDAAWYAYDDIIAGWRDSTSIGGKPYGIPYDGEATVQVYRTDVYDAAGLQPAQSLDGYLSNAKLVHDPANRLWGACVRGFAGPGQNMYVYPSIFRAFGGEWFNTDGKLEVNSPEAIAALEWYITLLNNYAPSGVENWNWPDIADAFSQGTVGSYLDAHSTAAVIANPERSKVVGKIGFARWPKGPSGKRVTSIWNWSFPINGALSDSAKKATWLFISWATSKENQVRTSYQFEGIKRSGVNRQSLWSTAEYTDSLADVGRNFIPAATESLALDTDVDWRPRVPEWPAVGDTMATAIQAALVGQQKPTEALNDAQAKIDKIMRQA